MYSVQDIWKESKVTGVRNKLKVPGDMKSIESSRVIELIKSTRGIRYNVVSATKGVRQKYIQCISGLVVYRQYMYIQLQ